MTTLYKITWKEFEKIIQALKGYRLKKVQKDDDCLWLDRILTFLSEVKNQPYNIDVGELKKNDFKKVALLMDLKNVMEDGTKNGKANNDEYKEISNKLQRAYFKTFNEHMFPND